MKQPTAMKSCSLANALSRLCMRIHVHVIRLRTLRFAFVSIYQKSGFAVTVLVLESKTGKFNSIVTDDMT